MTSAFSRAFNDEIHTADEARRLHAGNSRGTGHHWVPFGSTTGAGLDISSEARNVFGLATSGEKIPSALHNKDHSAYNNAVRGELQSWARDNDIDLSRMSGGQANDFVRHIRDGGSSNAAINNFTAKIHRYNGLAAPLGGAGKFLLRNVLVPAGFVGLADSTMSINQHACVMTPGNPCQR